MVSNYYDSVIKIIKNTDYQLDTEILSIKPVISTSQNSNTDNTKNELIYEEKIYNLQINSKIKLKSLDNLLIWKLDHCWLTERICTQNIPENEANEYDYSLLSYDSEYPENDFINTNRKRIKLNRLVKNNNQIESNSNNFKLGFDRFSTSYKKITDNKTSYYYDFEMNFVITMINFEIGSRKHYVMCNLRQCGTVNYIEPKKVKLVFTLKSKLVNSGSKILKPKFDFTFENRIHPSSKYYSREAVSEILTQLKVHVPLFDFLIEFKKSQTKIKYHYNFLLTELWSYLSFGKC